MKAAVGLRILRASRWPLSQWGLFAHALILHIGVAILLPLVPFGRLLRWGAFVYRPRGATGAPPEEERMVVWAVRRAAASVPRVRTCLSEALTAHWLLRVRGAESKIAFGVIAAASGRFVAHAWVERQGRRLIGATSVDYLDLRAAGVRS